MSYLHKTTSQCGRLVPKPEKQGRLEETYEDAIPIQDQIENLRAKISLKERYNKALEDDLKESNQGASSYIAELGIETKELRQKLMDAINSEKSAVQNALRTHREFQLAMTDRTPAIAIPWLDDKLFDMAKLLNSLLDRLKDKRKRLEDAEIMVIQIEKWPRPGTLPWEIEATATFNRLECMIESQKVKRETAFIINSKYIDIKYQLLAERGKYTSYLKGLEASYRILRNELSGLETMLDDAIYFRNESFKNLIITEEEASDNRKRRKIQMAKMKKAVERILEENQAAPAKQHLAKAQRSDMSAMTTGTMNLSDVAELLRQKRAEVEEYQARSRRLVETMRVADLTFIPIRLQTVATSGMVLLDELEAKEQLKELLLKQKAQLLLILCFYRYTGVAQLEEYYGFKKQYEESIEDAKKRHDEVTRRLDRLGSIQLNLRLGMLAVEEQLTEGKKKPSHRTKSDDMCMEMRLIAYKLSKLVDLNKELLKVFGNRQPERNYAIFVKPPPNQTRLIRVGTPHVSEESENDDDLMDSKVPTRVEIKAKSGRIFHQAMLKRGIR